MDKKNRILYITDASLETAYSGTARHIRNGFINNGFEVIECIVPLPVLPAVNFKKSIYNRFFKSIYIYKRDKKVIRMHNKNIKDKIKAIEYDIVFSNFEWNLSYLKTDKPIYCWPDNFFTDFVNFYASPWAKISIRNGLEQTKAYYKNTTATIYSSKWALDTAQKTDWVNSPVYFVPYGIGVKKSLSNAEILNKKKEHGNNLNLIWIGLDAERKGLKKSISIVNQLNDQGIKSVLSVIGISGDTTDNIHFYGKLSKHNPNELKQFQMLLTQADLMLFLTLADSTPMVIGEALSYGVPVITHNVGGVASLMDESCGCLFDLNSSVEDIVNWIFTYQKNEDTKREMAKNALQFADNNLNWDNSMASVCAIIQDHLNEGE